MVDRLPGAERADAVSIHDVLAGSDRRSGARAVVLDDLGDWRGLGTALHLAEAGHEVTIVTSAAVVGGGLFHSAADVPLGAGSRRPAGRCARTVVLGWDGGGGHRPLDPDRRRPRVAADTLVIAETPVAETVAGRRA